MHAAHPAAAPAGRAPQFKTLTMKSDLKCSHCAGLLIGRHGLSGGKLPSWYDYCARVVGELVFVRLDYGFAFHVLSEVPPFGFAAPHVSLFVPTLDVAGECFAQLATFALLRGR